LRPDNATKAAETIDGVSKAGLIASDPPSPLQGLTPMPPLKTARFALRTARIAGKVIKLGLRIQRARRGRGL